MRKTRRLKSETGRAKIIRSWWDKKWPKNVSLKQGTIYVFLLIILNATSGKLLIIIQWLLLPQLLSVHFVLLATAATNAAPRPEPSSDNMMSNSLSALTSLCIVSLM